MANEITVTVASVRPLTGARIRRAVAGEALAYGDAVYVSSYSGDLPVVSKTVGSAVATANPMGVAVATPIEAATSIASGDPVDVLTDDPVFGFSGMTSGATLWVSDTAGRLSSVVGSKSGVVGYAESPTVAFVRPGLFTVSS